MRQESMKWQRLVSVTAETVAFFFFDPFYHLKLVDRAESPGLGVAQGSRGPWLWGYVGF